MSFVLYGCEKWYLTSREELSKKVFENRVLKKIFGHKRDEVTGDWRRLHNEELYDLCSSPSIIPVIKSGRMRWSVRVIRLRERRGAYRILVEKPEGKRPLGIHRRSWECNSKMVLKKLDEGRELV